MDTTNQFLGTERIGSLMRKHVIPCVISLLVGALYNVMDQIFITSAGYLDSYGSTTNAIVFPLTIVALSVAVLVGDSCCAFVSISPGRSEVSKAEHSVGNVVTLVVASGFMLIAVYLLSVNITTATFGGMADEETFHYPREYFLCITLDISPYMSGQAMSPIIWADGNPKFATVSTLLDTVINITLDPLFIFDFRWGMISVAVAMILGQITTAVLPIWHPYNIQIIRPGHGDFGLARKICRRTPPLGIISFLSQISLAAVTAATNNMLRKYGALNPVFGLEGYTQIPTAMVGIVMKFFQTVISIVIDMAAGYIPVVGYNMGTGKVQRVKALFTRLLTAEATVGVVALFFAEGFPQQLVNIFGMANESSYYAEFAIKAFRTYLCMMITACVNKACFVFLQAVGKALAATMPPMLREVVFDVGFALPLPVFFGLDGVSCSMPVSDVLVFLIAVLIICKTYGELNTGGTELT